MGAINIQGYKGIVELQQTRSYSPSRGWTTSRMFRGPMGSIESLAFAFQQSMGAVVTLSVAPEDAGLGTLTVNLDSANDGNNEAASNGEPQAESDQWTLSGQDIELSIWSHPTVKALADNCSAEYMWLRKSIKAVKDNGTWLEVLNAYTATGGCHDDVKDIFKLMMNGVESFRDSAYTLRRSRTINSQNEGIISIANVNKVFSLTQLQELEGLPTSLIFGLDSSLEWLKSTPSLSYAGNKMSCENEYTGALDWSPKLYSNAS